MSRPLYVYHITSLTMDFEKSSLPLMRLLHVGVQARNLMKYPEKNTWQPKTCRPYYTVPYALVVRVFSPLNVRQLGVEVAQRVAAPGIWSHIHFVLVHCSASAVSL